MLAELLERNDCDNVQYIETTITPDNDASWALFRRFADKRRYRTETFILFDSRVHFSGAHKDEHLLRIGPFNRTPVEEDRKSTRLNSSHVRISYAVFCLKKKT